MNNGFERQVEIQQEAILREAKRKAENALNTGLLIGTQSKNPRIAQFCRDFLKGKVMGTLMVIIPLIAFCIGAIHRLPWLFTFSVAGSCIWFYFSCDKESRAIAYIVDALLLLFWAFMRFAVMPFSW